MTDTPKTPGADIVQLAAAHGLMIEDSSMEITEIGLDFRVAIAQTTDHAQWWVLRIPRRPDVMERAEVEGRLLKLVASLRSVEVPDWQIHTRELIAYPLLRGKPGLTIGETGEPIWHVDVSSTAFATSLGEALAELHGMDTDEARATGIEYRTPAEVRNAWRSDIATVATEFHVADNLMDRWSTWLNDDTYWPDHSVLTHGEIYPGHTLVVDQHISGIIDWTTAEVGDPARDFVFHHATASPAAFDTTVRRYVAGGGRVWPKLAEHCAHRFSANPVAYGLYAILTNDEQHRAAAAAQLNPVEH